MLFLIFVMVTAMFIHTFLNFFLGVYSAVVAKAEGLAPGAITSIEEFVASMWLKVVSFFKNL